MKLPGIALLRDPFQSEGQRIFTFLALAILLDVFALRLCLVRGESAMLDRVAFRCASRPWRLDLLTASEDEIALLPGVGPTRAREYTKMRAHGFIPISPLDLRAVPGFGFGTIFRIAPHVLLSGKVRAPP
ncbi:MAG: hypothetical protein HY286_01335 [Planctomycetes bacterium]|nr:hypothetical protein [Planctomycetota bacterium]